MIRIVAGTLGGRRLRTPPGLTTRPTAERVRQALFNILGPLPPGCTVWDLCAGSGALGIEALSRGAGQAIFVDSDAVACRVLRQNLVDLGLASRTQVVQAPLSRFLAGNRPSFQSTAKAVAMVAPGAPFSRVYSVLRVMPQA